MKSLYVMSEIQLAAGHDGTRHERFDRLLDLQAHYIQQLNKRRSFGPPQDVQAHKRDFAFAYRALPLADLPPIGTKPVMPKALRAA
mmetsp:Transcript_43545/g.66001  ORF Transcript_43545/g.66001 Transcript_43545/m.66001 type:complete len:86 (-) Transcript_43545:41-298(-)